jgi:hypothetical protein
MEEGAARGVRNGKQMSDWEQGVVAMISLMGSGVLYTAAILAGIRWVSGKDSPTLNECLLGKRPRLA